MDRDIWAMRKILFRALRDKGYKIRSWCGAIEPPNHLHIIVDADYIPQSVLSSLWLQITGNSKVVDIRQVNLDDISQVDSYLAKYISKADNWTKYFSLDELKGFHIVGCSGFEKILKPIPPWGLQARLISRAEFDELLSSAPSKLLLSWRNYLLPGSSPGHPSYHQMHFH